MTQKIKLYDILDTSYKKPEEQKKQLSNYGYKYDSILSNDNEQVYYNPTTNKLIFNVSGSHTLKDWLVTDVDLALGKLKNTDRYKEAKQRLTQAKQKYNTDHATISGQSLGGSIAGYIGNRSDDVYTLNKGVTFGMKNRDNEKHYRQKNDIVSSISILNNQKTNKLNNNHHFLDVINNHSIDNLKNSNIYID